jgi:glycosyltransferase involved in cell wall biosynthesis
MKIVVISHTYTAKINREKLYLLNNKARVFLITPNFWKDDLMTIKAERDKILKHFIIKTIFNGHEKIYFYFPSFFIKILEIKPDIIYVEQGADALSYFQSILAKKLFWPKAKTVFFTWMNLPYRNPFPLNIIEKFNLKNTDCAICGNQDAKEILRKRGYKGPIEVMPQLGIDPELFKNKNADGLRARLGINKEFLIGFFGRFVVEKGILTMIDALKDLKGDWKCLLIGRGPLKEEIVRKINSYNLKDRFIILNPVPHEKLIDYFNILDLYILPSETTHFWKEQFGHAILEAMACEVPVIGSNSGEIPNVIGDAGLIFKEGDSNDLREKIQFLMNNPEARKALALKGRKRVIEKYTHEKLAERTYELFKKIID